MIQLDLGDHRPLYEQIRDKLKEMIIEGLLLENDRIPSVREMAQTLAINPNTIQKAYRELEGEGYIYSVKAKGFFVSDIKHTTSNGKIAEIKEEIKPYLKELKFLGVKKESICRLVEKIYEEDEI
ncbi:MAG: GntR family transcriptional regulator [Ruminococcaceae bacterium]|nr:GntR family transcriptional regulator [Oscillospiraceae bacterium]